MLWQVTGLLFLAAGTVHTWTVGGSHSDAHEYKELVYDKGWFGGLKHFEDTPVALHLPLDRRDNSAGKNSHGIIDDSVLAEQRPSGNRHGDKEESGDNYHDGSATGDDINEDKGYYIIDDPDALGKIDHFEDIPVDHPVDPHGGSAGKNRHGIIDDSVLAEQRPSGNRHGDKEESGDNYHDGSATGDDAHEYEEEIIDDTGLADRDTNHISFHDEAYYYADLGNEKPFPAVEEQYESHDDVETVESIDHKPDEKQILTDLLRRALKLSVAFSANYNSQPATPPKLDEPLIFSQLTLQHNSNFEQTHEIGYSPKTGFFQAPIAGLYMFQLSLALDCMDCHLAATIGISNGEKKINVRNIARLHVSNGDSDKPASKGQSSISTVALLEKGEEVAVYVTELDGKNIKLTTDKSSFFTGTLMKKTYVIHDGLNH